MALTLLPKSPRTTIILVVALIGALVFVMTSGGTSKKRGGGGAAALATATEAAQALADLAVPGPNAGAQATATAPPDTAFGVSPFRSLDESGVGSDGLVGPESEDDDTITEESDAAALDGPRRLLGTAVGEERALALIDGHYVSAGQYVAGWKVQFVGPREARLEKDGRTLTLRVGRD